MSIGPKYKVIRLIQQLQAEIDLLEATDKKTRSPVKKADLAGQIKGFTYSKLLLRSAIR